MTEGIANYFGVLLMAIRAVFEYFWLPVGKILIFFSTLSTLYLATCAKYRCRQYPLFRCNLMPARALPRIRQKYEGESISIVMPSGLSPMGKKSRGGRGLLALWHGRKIEFSPPNSALACRARLPCTLRRHPWGSEASPGLHRHRGGPNFKNAPALTPSRGLHSLTATASPMGKKSRGGRGLLAPWDVRKVEFSPPNSALACRARLPCTLRRHPWGSEASPGLHRHRGGPNFKNAPALTRGLLVHYNMIYIYIRVTLTARSTE
jgi:hypothetical protein